MFVDNDSLAFTILASSAALVDADAEPSIGCEVEAEMLGTSLSTTTGLDEATDAYDVLEPAFGCGKALNGEGPVSL